MRKYILFCLLVSLSFSVAVAQTTMVQHEVKKGETLESVAKSYGVTPKMIKDVNPQMGNFFYVGMKLNIPEKKESMGMTEAVETESTVVEQSTSTPKKQHVFVEQTKTKKRVVEEQQEEEYSGSYDSNSGHWSGAFEIGYGFVDEGFGYKATIGANYWITDNAYAGARIGYNGYSASDTETDGSYNLYKYERDIHMLSMPLEVGYALGTSKVALIPFLGFDFNLGLTGKDKLNDEEAKLKVGGKLGVAFDAGARLRLWGWNISGIYHIPINEKQEAFFGEDGYFELSIGFGF